MIICIFFRLYLLHIIETFIVEFGRLELAFMVDLSELRNILRDR